MSVGRPFFLLRFLFFFFELRDFVAGDTKRSTRVV